MNTHRPLWIGLTGGIASGKSTVANEFAKLGVPIIDGDVLAREVTRPGAPALQTLMSRFGPDILNNAGELDRGRMRERIFNDPIARQALEAILHPAIRARQQALSAQLGGEYQIHVIPLLVETGTQALYDRILVVDCPRETQLARLLARDGITPELAEMMLSAQADRATRLAAANDIIDNQTDLSDLSSKVAALHAQYLRQAQTLGDTRT